MSGKVKGGEIEDRRANVLTLVCVSSNIDLPG